MCGIGGYFALRPIAPSVAAAMQAALRPRGPDAEHVSSRNGNTLLHARLSIIDPRPEADQPMTNEQGDISIVYNGEVYDWERWAAELRASGIVFRTRSDTEFILRGYEAWGIEKLLQRLRGMFAFAILDARRGKAYLARDRMGEKPLVYCELDGELAFGSLVRAVLPFLPPGKRELSPEGIDAYLAHRYIPAPRTVFARIQRLENGHYLEFDLRTRRLAKRRYWRQERAAGEAWLTALDESVRMRTIADRPLGLLLSGGMDSAVIASRLARQDLARYQSFTASFPGTEFDELEAARRTAAVLGLPNMPVPVPDDVEKVFSDVVAALDEPFADPSGFPTWLLAREVSRHVKVVLVGDGGDELFAGYKRFATHLRTRWRRRWKLPFAIRPSVEGRKLVAELAMDWRHAYSLRFSGFTPSQRAFLQGGRAFASLCYWREPEARGATPLEELLAIDLENYLPEYILRKSDLCTMAHGLEARAPLLDHRFVECLLSVPAPARFTVPPKALLRAALDPSLQGDLAKRKKRGFNPPLRKWLRGALAPRFDGLGARLEARSAGQLKAGPVDKFTAYYRAGAEHCAERVLQLLMLDESLGQLAGLARARA